MYSRSNPGFFKIGLISPHFQSSANSPEFRDRLIILVMTGNSTSAQLITIRVDIGSSLQLFGEQPINSLTALSVKGMKLSSVLVGDVFPYM